MYGRLRPADCRLEDLERLLDASTSPDAYPHSSRVEQGVPVYDARSLRAAADTAEGEDEVTAELALALADGPGIVVVTGAFDHHVVDRVSSAFTALIDDEKSSGRQAGDHFARPGANDRVWNALEKLAMSDPEAYVDYYANDVLALAARAWLGPGYQVTSQVNVVNPGGEGQTVHRDYHLGFLGPEASAAYPAHVHALSPTLTLQGAVAHCDMPVETGPTLYLPHSQKYAHGYLAYWRADFQDYFRDHHVQLPLSKGDAVFFNPALFHAAGSNRSTSVRRMANLLQVSSAFGRAMEVVDRGRVVRAIYPALLHRARHDRNGVARAVAASAEGYPFPTDLDRDQPVDGLAPPSQADLVLAALDGGTPADELGALLEEHASLRR